MIVYIFRFKSCNGLNSFSEQNDFKTHHNTQDHTANYQLKKLKQEEKDAIALMAFGKSSHEK